MKKNSYIFNSNLKNLFLGIISGLLLIFIISLVVNLIIKNSNFRLSKVFSTNSLSKYETFYVGNSRSVSFNRNTIENIKFYNLSYNSLNYHEVENILYAIKKKNIINPTIYIEATALINDNVECRFSIFSNLKYYNKEKILEKCKTDLFLQKFFPISKVKNEIFLRVLYYSFFKEEDQRWQNNYLMPEKTCLEGNLSPFAQEIIKLDSQKKMIVRANNIIEKYSDFNIKFFITPIFNKKENYSLKIENEFIKNLKKGFLLPLNNQIDKNFYTNCKFFADNLHLSPIGIKKIKFLFLNN